MRHTKSLPLIFALFALITAAMACSLPGQQVVVVTATPSPAPVTPSVTPIPTEPPTLTPIPSPTTAPMVAIDQAASALLNGDYDAAVKIYQSILNQPILSVDPRLRSDASIGMGTAALREGQFSDAVDALSDFITTYPTESRA